AGLRPLRVVLRAARVVTGRVPVGAPLPDVAGHVVKPVAVRRVRCDRGRSGESVRRGIVFGELALKRVRPPLAAGALLLRTPPPPEPRTPTRPRSAAASRPTGNTRPHRARRCARRDGSFGS